LLVILTGRTGVRIAFIINASSEKAFIDQEVSCGSLLPVNHVLEFVRQHAVGVGAAQGRLSGIEDKHLAWRIEYW